MERSRPRPRVPRATEGAGTAQLTSTRAHVLTRIRLTRTAAERGPVLSGACGPAHDLRQNVMLTPLVGRANPSKMGTGVNGTYLSRVTVEDSVLDRFGHVDCRDLLGSFQVSDGAGHATDFVVRACAEAKLFDRFA